jgi:hypothetical protein
MPSNCEMYWRYKEIEEKFNVTIDIELVPQRDYVQMLKAVMKDGEGIPDIIEWIIEDNRILNEDPDKCLVLPLDDYVENS